MTESIVSLDELVEQWIQEVDEKHVRRVAMMRRAWRLIKPEVERATPSADGALRLDRQALERICRRIDRPDNPRAQRWLEKTAVNQLLYRLWVARLLQSPYLNVPRQVPRPLAVKLEQLNPSDLRKIQQLRDNLARRSPLAPPPAWRWSMTVWYFCEFVASAILHSGILVPGLLAKLLNCESDDLAQRRWIALPQHTPRQAQRQWIALPQHTPHQTDGGRERVRLRYPLVQQTLRFLRNALRIPEQTPSNAEDRWVFSETWRSPMWTKEVFAPAWRMFLETAGLKPKHVSVHRLLANLTRYATLLAVLDGLPPFLISVATSKITASPMTLISFRRHFVEQCDGQRRRPGAVLPPPPRARRRQQRESRSVSLFDRIEKIRLRLRREHKIADRHLLAKEIRELIGPRPFSLPEPVAEPATIFEFNARCYGAWVAALLEGRDRPGTVATRCSALAAAFPSHFDDRPIPQWHAQNWESTMSTILEDHETSSIKAAFKRFIAFLQEENLVGPVTINWRSPALSKVPSHKPVPLVGFRDFDQAFLACQEIIDEPPLQRLLQVMAILGFFAGLRSSEATHLELRHIILDPEPLLEVRVTKTREGLRNLYLARLIPEPYLSILVAFYNQRLQETGGDPYAPLLATPDHPARYDSSTLSSYLGLALRQTIGESLCFHHLRHAFASWFLLRWIVAIDAVAPDPEEHSWARTAVFQPPAIAGLRSLLFGLQTPRQGQAEFSHGLVVLCRLLGHGSPATTLSAYCHTLDVLHALLKGHPM